jgi:protein-disulfide isomerase
VWKNLPLAMHKNAPAAHAAAAAAQLQGRFWEMHDLIFANQRDLAPQTFLGYARQLGLDVDRYQRDFVSEQVRKLVADDTAEAGRLGVTGTPAFFINGRFLSGAKPFDEFQKIIDEELKKGG